MKRPRVPPRQLPWAVFALSLALTATATGLVAREVRARRGARLDGVTRVTAQQVASRIDAYVIALRSAAALFGVHPEVDRRAFHTWVGRLRLDEFHPGIQGFGYAPRVDPAAVAAFEAAAGAEGFAGYRVDPPGPRDPMFAIRYLEPLDARNLAALGYDMFTEPVRREAMTRAWGTGRPAVSGAVTLRQEISAKRQRGFLIYVPMYRGGAVPDDEATRRSALVGFTYAAFRAGDLFDEVVRHSVDDSVAVQVWDGDDAAATLLYDGAVGVRGGRRAAHAVTVAGRRWRVVCVARASFANDAEASAVWILGVFGTLVSAFLFGATRWQLRARLAVEASEAAKDRALAQEREARAEGERLVAALARSNEELDQFAYVASHDLKAPLRGIANLAEWIEEDLGDRLAGEAREHMDLLRKRVRRLEAMIDGILQYSRAARVRERAERVDVGALVAEVVDLLAPRPPAEVVVAPSMPVIEAERAPLQRVFINLIGNALKHARRDDVRVEVSAEAEGPLWRFVVRDNGPGIAPEYHDRVWAIFQTLQARDQVEGTGIGLSVVRKIVEAMGGRAGVDSAAGAGASFWFTWPAAPAPVSGTPRR